MSRTTDFNETWHWEVYCWSYRATLVDFHFLLSLKAIKTFVLCFRHYIETLIYMTLQSSQLSDICISLLRTVRELHVIGFRYEIVECAASRLLYTDKCIVACRTSAEVPAVHRCRRSCRFRHGLCRNIFLRRKSLAKIASSIVIHIIENGHLK
jgi:hypothetical protein